jgi:gamma-glutamylcyclotransferase (GGCT)/AIG2-like uncharacterized protein YtfP
VLATVFVYGTLMPGHLRWGLIAPFALASQPASVDGVVYDTHQGWPAARFRGPLAVEAIPDDRLQPTSAVPGWLVELEPSSVATLLALLDEVEGAVAVDELAPPDHPDAGGAYRRVRVRAQDGTVAWAYEALTIGAAWEVVTEWSGRDEN